MRIDFLKNIVLGQSASGLHITVGPDGAVLCNYVVLCKEREGIVVASSGTVSDLESACTKLDPSVPLFFSVDGKGIIIRKMSDLNGESEDMLLHRAIPNARLDDFYYQIYREQAEILLAVCRRDAVDTYLVALAEKKFFVHGIGIGFAVLLPILQSFYDDELLLPNWRLLNNRQRLPEFERVANGVREYAIASDMLASDILIPYASALQFYTGVALSGNTISITHGQVENFYYSRLIRKGGLVLLGVFFVLLLGNYLLFDKFYKERKRLEEEVSSNEILFKKLDRLKDDLAGKKKILGIAGDVGLTRFSYYADRLALGLPKTIQLDELEFFPLEKKLKKAKLIQFKKGALMVYGTVGKSTDLYKWIDDIGTEPWVQEASVMDYSHESGERTGTFVVEIILEGGTDVQK